MNCYQTIQITDIRACQLLDSRGIPTVSVNVILSDGSIGEASVPSGASTGKYEAYEKRDSGDSYHGKSVQSAIESIHSEIKPFLLERSPKSLSDLDTLLCKLDGTSNKKRLGANAILATSLAFAKAAFKAI